MDVENLNPFIGFGSSYEVWCLNYDFLVGYERRGRLAASRRSPRAGRRRPTARVWTFHIRRGVTWQDGEPLTAKDVAFSLNYIVDNQLASYSTYTKLIERAEAVDDYTVRGDLLQAQGEHAEHVPVRPAGAHLEQGRPEERRGLLQELAADRRQRPLPVRRVEEGRVRTHGRPTEDYWKGAPHVDEVIFEFYTNPDVMAQDLRSGRLDGATGLPAATFPTIEDDPDLEGDPVQRPVSWDYLCFNCYDDAASRGHPVLRDVKLRRGAVVGGRPAEVRRLSVTGGTREPGTTIITPGQWPDDFDAHYQPTPEETIGFDLDKARRLLDEAGYTDSNGDGVREYKGKPIQLRLNARTDSQSSQIQGKLITGWFTGHRLEDRLHRDRPGRRSPTCSTRPPNGGNTYAPDYDMYLWDWGGYIDPGDTLSSFITDQIWIVERPLLVEPRVRPARRGAVQRAGHAEAALDLLHRMQQIFYVEAPYVVIDYPDSAGGGQHGAVGRLDAVHGRSGLSTRSSTWTAI